jgi:hypothetical protein
MFPYKKKSHTFIASSIQHIHAVSGIIFTVENMKGTPTHPLFCDRMLEFESGIILKSQRSNISKNEQQLKDDTNI